MKKNILIIASFIFIISCVGYLYKKQKDIGYVLGDCEGINMQNVKNQAQVADNNTDKYSHTSKDILGQSSQGGQQTNYISNGKSVLIKQTFYGETGKSEASYYLNDGKVFYFTKKNTEYILPISEDSSGKVKSAEVKDFFLDKNQNLCFWYNNQKLQQNDQSTKELVDYLISNL